MTSTEKLARELFECWRKTTPPGKVYWNNIGDIRQAAWFAVARHVQKLIKKGKRE